MSCSPATGSYADADATLGPQFIALNVALPPPGDLAAYRTLLGDRAGQVVVYVGPGAGRRAITLAAAGYLIVAVEANAALADAFSAKLTACPPAVRERVTLVRGRIEEAPPVEEAAAVLAPSLLLNYAVTEPACQQAFLRACRAQLAPGGLLAVELYNPYLLMTAGVTQLRPGPAEPGAQEWLSTTIYRAGVDPWTQRCAGYRQIAERFVPGGAVQRYVTPTAAVVAVFPRELALLLAATGFRLDGFHALAADLRPPGTEDVSVLARATAC